MQIKNYKNLEYLKRIYQPILQTKKIRTAKNFNLIIQQDLIKLVHSLYELKNISTLNFLSLFFTESIRHTVMNIISKNAQHRLHHIGFEIYAPMDLVVDIFKQQMKRMNQSRNSKLKIIKIHRFPASKAFQARVNAYSEIMRLWIELYQHTFMLELFEIHHPIQIHQNLEHELVLDKPMIEQLLSPNTSIVPKQLMPNRLIFKQDTIWHYAIQVNNQDIVRQLHDCFKNWIRHTQDYQLAFSSIVTNTNDGSFLTKIINVRQGIELEFIAQESVDY